MKPKSLTDSALCHRVGAVLLLYRVSVVISRGHIVGMMQPGLSEWMRCRSRPITEASNQYAERNCTQCKATGCKLHAVSRQRRAHCRYVIMSEDEVTQYSKCSDFAEIRETFEGYFFFFFCLGSTTFRLTKHDLIWTLSRNTSVPKDLSTYKNPENHLISVFQVCLQIKQYCFLCIIHKIGICSSNDQLIRITNTYLLLFKFWGTYLKRHLYLEVDFNHFAEYFSCCHCFLSSSICWHINESMCHEFKCGKL